ncbi:hypothetical protein [Paracnuella aquatica]|uniref:hypothetical protein n=1 Tax=Paracnuella aquatica TaxID=2268757 RepID=UPI000DEF6FC4|nr:hypothetical protein [Paracnuella aquatica]RPD45114.1 hypothetical protein DRJ53_15860 [Paracnuella aquatica]
MRLFLCIICLGALFAGCGSANKQKELQARELAVQQKERALNSREQELAIREELLVLKERKMDSTIQADSTIQLDSAWMANPDIAGKWNVQMTCTETTCPGSAVGDIKTEQWEIVQQANTIIARALVNDQLVRVYTGGFTDGLITLTEEQATGTATTPVKMSVQLKRINKTRIEGKREIIREKDCRIVYNLQLDASTK